MLQAAAMAHTFERLALHRSSAVGIADVGDDAVDDGELFFGGPQLVTTAIGDKVHQSGQGSVVELGTGGGFQALALVFDEGLLVELGLEGLRQLTRCCVFAAGLEADDGGEAIRDFHV
jgi:hypothetical protein